MSCKSTNVIGAVVTGLDQTLHGSLWQYLIVHLNSIPDSKESRRHLNVFLRSELCNGAICLLIFFSQDLQQAGLQAVP